MKLIIMFHNYFGIFETFCDIFQFLRYDWRCWIDLIQLDFKKHTF